MPRSNAPWASSQEPALKEGIESPEEAVEGYLAPPPQHPASGETDLLDAMEAMKPLVASLGKEQVKRIVDLLG